jgi:hypothetical protein
MDWTLLLSAGALRGRPRARRGAAVSLMSPPRGDVWGAGWRALRDPAMEYFSNQVNIRQVKKGKTYRKQGSNLIQTVFEKYFQKNCKILRRPAWLSW